MQKQEMKNYYNPPLQPCANGGKGCFADCNVMDSDAVIEKLYEPLRVNNPQRITRENIGKDSSGKYDMWCYIFAPENYNHTVYLSAGSHGMNEAQSYLALASLLQLVWNDDVRNNDVHLNLLREKVRFIVIPVVNVWDVSERVNGNEKTFSPFNSNNVNLNRNWLSESPEQEITNIKKVLDKYKDEIDFGFDLHTDPEGFPGWGSYLLIYSDGVSDSFSDKLKEVCEYLDNKNFVSKGIAIKKAFRGADINYPQGSSIDVNKTPDYPKQSLAASGSSVLWSKYKIPSATLEHGSRKYGNRLFCDADDITAAVELYANQILRQLI